MKTNILKRISAFALLLVLAFCLSACGQTKGGTDNNTDTKSEETKTGSTENTESTESTVLVAYFSATGTTKGVAEKIAKVTGGELYEIIPEKEYTSDDLNWNDKSSRSTIEQNNSSARPEIKGEKISLDGFSTIYIGYPIWWGEEPRIMDTFVESYDFGNTTVIPFCTSGSSDIGKSGENLKDNAKSGNWLSGKRFDSGATETEIADFVNSIK